MSDIRFNRWLHQSGTGGVSQDSTGNIGIGSTQPLSALDLGTGNIRSHNIHSTGIVTTIGLDINGNADISGNLNVGGVLTYEDVTNIDAVGIITARSGIHVTGGSVGIGTDNPTQNLDILGSSTSTVLIRASTLNGTAKLQLQDSLGRDNFIAVEDADNLVFAADEGNAGGDSYMRFKVDGDEKVRITSTGQVGIGTDNPQRDLVVYKPTSDSHLSLVASQGEQAIVLFGDSDNDAIGQIRYDNTDNSMAFRVNTSERLRIDSSGRLQIGASNNSGANTKLVVGAGNNINTTAIINTGDVDVDALTLSNWDGSTTTNKVTIHFDSSGIGGWNIGMPAATDAFVIEDDGGSERLRITSDGKLGVGTNNPALTAHIYNTAAADVALIESTQNFATLRFKSATNTSGPTIGIDGAGGLQMDQKDTSKYIAFAVGSERVRINQNGCLQVGSPSGTPSHLMELRTASGDPEVVAYAPTGQKTIFNCTGSNRFALERGYNSVFEIQDPNGNNVRSDLRFDGNIILNRGLGGNGSAVQLYRLIGPDHLSLASGMAILTSQTDTMSQRAARISTSNNNGTAFFGPYGRIHPGSYTAMFHMKVSNNSNTSTIIRIDVAGTGITDAGGYGDHRPRALNLAPSHFDNADRYQYIGLDFNFVNVVGSNVIEVRGLNFNNSRSADLYLDHILIVPRIPHHAG